MTFTEPGKQTLSIARVRELKSVLRAILEHEDPSHTNPDITDLRDLLNEIHRYCIFFVRDSPCL